MVKRATKKIRGKVLRERKKIILIGTEGKNKTETKYFNKFNRLLTNFTIQFSNGNETDSLGVINNTVSSMNQYDIRTNEGDMVFALIDYDVKQSKQHFQKVETAQNKANKYAINVLISNPIFEIWYLQHFRYSTKSYNSNEEVLNDLKLYIPDYQKNSDVFDFLFKDINCAIQRSKKLELYHKDNDHLTFDKKCPSTEIYKLVEILIKDINDR